MAFSANDTVTAALLNARAELRTGQAWTAVQQFSNAGNFRAAIAADLLEQSTTPATPAGGLARLYSTNDNPPRLSLIEDDGGLRIVGGYTYDESRRAWVLINPDTTAMREDQVNQIVIRNDFFTIRADTTNNFITTTQGSWRIDATGAYTYTASTFQGGGMRFGTGAALNNRTAIILASAAGGVGTRDGGSFQIADNVQFEMILSRALPATVTEKIVQCGIAEDPAAATNPGDEGIYFQFNQAVNANWRGIVRSSGANTDSDLTVVADNELIHLRFVVTSGTNVIFYTRADSTAAWTLRATNTGAQPASDVNMIPFLRVQTTDAVAKDIIIRRAYMTGYLEA